MKKPFKESKLGQFLATKAPKVLDAVSDILPDQGVLGIVKNILSRDPDVTPEDHIEFEKLAREYEIDLLQMEVDDRKSAREREVEVAKTGKHDFLMYIVGGIILVAFAVVVYASVFMQASGETFVRISTMVETLTVAIVSYYFGSSKGSSEKTKLLQQ